LSINQRIDKVEARRKLDSFLVDNPELETLNAKLAQFNLFRILKIERAEIRHSNVLAWLLDPKETHGLGAAFLRRFLSRILIENEGVDVPFTPARVELMRLEDVEVFRERDNIDIFVHSRLGRWVLLIENKIRSRESDRQLKKYIDLTRKNFPRHAFIPVYLTLEGDDPSEEGKQEGYVSVSYNTVLEVAERIVEQNRSRIPTDAATLLDHYLVTLRRLTMNDRDLVDLCKKIYGRHREAIDWIVQLGASNQVLDACEALANDLVGADRVTKTVNRVFLLPKEMAQFEITRGSGWGFLPTQYPVMWWYYFGKNISNLKLVMEVGPIADPDYRIRLLKNIKKAGFVFREKKAFGGAAKYTRILRLSQKLRAKEGGEEGDIDDSPAYITSVAQDLWKKGWADGKKIVEILKACKPKAIRMR